MNELLTQVGVGGILALLVLDRVFAFLKQRNRNGVTQAGDQPIEFWRDLNKKIMLESLESVVVPILRQQTEILARLESRNGTSFEMHVKHGYILEDIQKSLERLRITTHTNNEILQKLGGRS